MSWGIDSLPGTPEEREWALKHYNKEKAKMNNYEKLLLRTLGAILYVLMNQGNEKALEQGHQKRIELLDEIRTAVSLGRLE